ncbi:MAG: response regulator [Alphaproteobacteria bacterium]
MSGKKILVIDDEVDFAGFVGEAGRRLGYDVEVCHASAEAKRRLADIAPDLIVLDIVMPGEDGVEFLQWLRGQPLRPILILMTGYNPKYAEMAGALGRVAGLEVAALLTKPVRIKALQEVLNKHLPLADADALASTTTTA